ncbi:phosphatase [Lactobacillus nasalidis]|uniref:Phosphatase n=1 Tax=Lactobacillus nasalidis TaxID=2797258 RepID=A0ABQ3W830_9LACO|nr:HAD family hydrolase [Lactobacillus nasalidis]GHV97224.1 phosphatase [Lactobacillus nasalidis]GHV99840.1 phosphatase [Lactobacillus nasalidis]GHW01686.1 phosphatase [Lactobacillus nasalidis]
METYFFDFDGTICESRHIYAASVQKAFEARGVKVPSREAVYQAMGIPIDVSIARWAQEGHRGDLAQTLFEESMAEYKLLEDSQIRIFPGIVKTLTQLKLAGKQLFVCSSKTHPEIVHNLEKLGLADLFADCVGADEVVNHKPASDEIDLLVKRHGLDLTEAVMLGDAKYDIRMGKNAGCATCACTWGAFDPAGLKKEGADYTVDYPLEILDI